MLEAQVVDAADSLAYDTHDIDDALGIGLITLDDLDSVEFWRRGAQTVHEQYPQLRGDPLRRAVVRELIAWQVADLVAETEKRLIGTRISSVADVRDAPAALVGFSEELTNLKGQLESFLRMAVYRHLRVQRMARKGRRLLRSLFDEFVARPELLPQRSLRRWAKE